MFFRKTMNKAAVWRCLPVSQDLGLELSADFDVIKLIVKSVFQNIFISKIGIFISPKMFLKNNFFNTLVQNVRNYPVLFV